MNHGQDTEVVVLFSVVVVIFTPFKRNRKKEKSNKVPNVIMFSTLKTAFGEQGGTTNPQQKFRGLLSGPPLPCLDRAFFGLLGRWGKDSTPPPPPPSLHTNEAIQRGNYVMIAKWRLSLDFPTTSENANTNIS